MSKNLLVRISPNLNIFSDISTIDLQTPVKEGDIDKLRDMLSKLPEEVISLKINESDTVSRLY